MRTKHDHTRQLAINNNMRMKLNTRTDRSGAQMTEKLNTRGPSGLRTRPGDHQKGLHQKSGEPKDENIHDSQFGRKSLVYHTAQWYPPMSKLYQISRHVGRHTNTPTEKYQITQQQLDRATVEQLQRMLDMSLKKGGTRKSRK